MKKILLMVIGLFAFSAFADDSDSILRDVYGSFLTACQTKQLATTGDNRLDTALLEGRRYLVYCTDGAGVGVACKCLQGESTVTVASKAGVSLFAGEKIIMRVTKTYTQLSCQSFSATPYVYVCLLD